MPGPVTIQNSYSLVSRSVDNDLAEALFREKHVAARLQPARRRHAVRQVHGRRAAAGRALHAVRHLGLRFRKPIVPRRSRRTRSSRSERGLSLVQLALGYVKSRWFLGASIIGATSLAQLGEDIAAAQFELDADTLADIAAMQLRYPNPAG